VLVHANKLKFYYPFATNSKGLGFEFKEGKKEGLLNSNESLNKCSNEKENKIKFVNPNGEDERN
jgi:hypothetical protein